MSKDFSEFSGCENKVAVLEFLRRKVRPAWTYQVQGIIWRVVPADPGLIVGESRDIGEKLATFFCLNQSDGSPLWEGVSFPDKWWIGIEAIHNDRALLHGFATPDMPGHKGITAVDTLTGKTVWSNHEVAFLGISDDSVIVSKGTQEGGRSLFELDIRSGRLVSETDDNTSVVGKLVPHTDSASMAGLTFPVPLTMISEQGAVVARKHLPHDGVLGEPEAIEHAGVLLLGFHHRPHDDREGEASITDSLKIVDLNKGVALYAEDLNTGASHMVSDMFFTHDDMLYYVKDRATLVAINLDEVRR